MPPLAFLPPNTASQRRSERIPNDVWEKYKVDVVREYQQGGTMRALHWIKNQQIPDFLPSYRQLGRQLKVKWQVSETATEDVDDEQTYATDATAASSQLVGDNGHVLCGNEINTKAPIAGEMSTAEEGLRNTILVKDNSTVTQPYHHSKTSFSFQEESKRQSGGEKRKTSSILEYDEPSRKKRKEMQQLPHGPWHQIFPSCNQRIASENPDINADLETTIQNVTTQIRPFQVPKSNFITSVENNNSSSEKIDLSNKSEDSDSWSTSSNRDQIFDTELLKIDYKRPISSYSSKEIERIKNAAEYLFCCSYYEDAFRLFYIVWKDSERDLTTSEFSSHKENFKAIIPLARAATNEGNRAMVQNILRRKLTMTPIFLDKLLLEFIMRIWELPAVCHQSEQTSEGKEIISFPDLAQILHSRMSDTSFTVKWLTIFVLVFHKCRPAVDITSPSIPLCFRALEHFLSPPDEQFSSLKALLLKSRIRILFVSCRKYLEEQTQLLSPWKSFRQYSVDKNWANSMAIFSHLWRLWYDRKNQSNPFDGTRIGFETMEKETGISVAELFRVCAFLILDAAPVENKTTRRLSISRYLEDREGDLLRRARVGVEVLCGMKCSELSSLFAHQFVKLASSALLRQDSGPRFTVHMTPKNFIQKPLQIILPTTKLSLPRIGEIRKEMKSEEDGSSKARPSMSDPSSMALTGHYDPTFTSSLTSSSFSSFRRQAFGIRQELHPSKPPSLSDSSRLYSGIDDLSETLSLLSVHNFPFHKQRN